MKRNRGAAIASLLFISLALTTPGRAQLMRISAGDFTPEASVITFSEQPFGTVNPLYDITTATLGDVTVSFASNFVGQTRTGTSPVSLAGSPTNPLTLSADGDVFIANDGSNPTSPVLSGSPTFNGPISVKFSKPVAAVALDGGFFNAIGGTSIEAYGANGTSLGMVQNSALGIEFFGLADASGDNVISGISFSITGAEPFGFAIDNLTFGSARELSRPPGGMSAVPEPANYAAWAATALLLFASRRRLRLSAAA